MKVGYVPYSNQLDAPGDLRRFCFYASERGVPFEIADADHSYDIVVLSGWADVTAWSRYPPPAKIVYDIVDSYLSGSGFGIKDAGRGLVKRFAGQTRHLALNYRKAIEQMARRADAIVCASEEQRQELLPYCSNVHVILDYPDELTLGPKRDYGSNTPLRLVWEGLPYNLGAFEEIAPLLRALSAEHGIKLRIITNSEFYAYARRFGKRRSRDILDRLVDDYELYEWNAQEMPRLIRECDVAVIPISMDEPLAVGKSENKLVLLWRLGMPTVTSATPAYIRTMRDAGLDMTAGTSSEWRQNLEALIVNPAARERAGTLGCKFATEVHSREKTLERWATVWNSITT